MRRQPVALAAVLMLLGAMPAASQGREEVYDRSIDAVFQIRVIDEASGEKSSIGSGFLLSPRGHIATNYHVVSSIIHRPAGRRLEYLSHDGRTGPLELRAIDVVHDLAILRADLEFRTPLPLGDVPTAKGSIIYSMGNPHDLGMTIVEGVFNGLLESSLYRKILFSGSLNPGMSGGPALDEEGRVVGVNVSTGGNQLSFLVPTSRLERLFERMPEETPVEEPDWHREIEEQLLANQELHISSFLDGEWRLAPLGPLLVPTRISSTFKCWGGTSDDEDRTYDRTYSQCSSEDHIYLTSEFRTGEYAYRYEWLRSDRLDPLRFHTLYETSFDQPIRWDNAEVSRVRGFRCRSGFVRAAERTWKGALCARRYDKYPRLYDAQLNLALLGDGTSGFIVRVVAQGSTKERSLELFRKFMESLTWAE